MPRLLLERLDQIINNAIPPHLLAARDVRQRARMFILSHMFGPLLGNVIPAYLLYDDPSRWPVLAVLFASITSFWLYLPALRAGVPYLALCFLSIQNLLFAITWGCYHYGGLGSPFIPWLVTVPLLAFFYVGGATRTIVLFATLIAVNVVIFGVLHIFSVEQASGADADAMKAIGLISTASAAIYVSMMSLAFARILTSQRHFEQEHVRQREAAAAIQEATQRTERANAAKSEFIAKMTHELRTPLNAIIGYSQLILEELSEAGAPGHTEVRRINSAGCDLLSMIDAVLLLAKLDAGKLSMYLDSFDLRRLVSECLTTFPQGYGHVEIRSALPVAPLLIVSDHIQLGFVITTLLRTALKAAGNKPIEIDLVEHEADAVVFRVRNFGEPIEPSRLPRLFDKFNTLADQASSKYDSAGLSLPLSKRLAKLLNANLRVMSDAESTTFELRHPRQLAPSTQA